MINKLFFFNLFFFLTWSWVASYLSGCEPLAGTAHLNIIRCRCEQGPKAVWALLPSPPRVAVRRVKLVETFSSLLFERNASRQLARDFSSGKESRGEEGYSVGGWGLARKEMWCGGEVPGAGVVSHGACPTLYRWAATGKGDWGMNHTNISPEVTPRTCWKSQMVSGPLASSSHSGDPGTEPSSEELGYSWPNWEHQ